MAKKSAPKEAAPAKKPPAKPAKAAPKPAKAAPKPAKAAPKPAKAAPKPPPFRPAGAADLKDLRKSVEREFKICRKNEFTLGKRIDEVGAAGEEILGEVERIRKDFTAANLGLVGERLNRAEKALADLRNSVETLRKESAKAGSDSGLCNAGPLAESFKGVDRKVAGLSGEMETLRSSIRQLLASLTAKVDELSAKFNLHSHFLQAKNWAQDLLFHLEPSVGMDKASPLPDANKPLMTKPARSTKEPPAFSIDLRLTPPRHWDDPVIWFDNVGPIEKGEEKK
jgi:hypothetical protein